MYYSSAKLSKQYLSLLLLLVLVACTPSLANPDLNTPNMASTPSMTATNLPVISFATPGFTPSVTTTSLPVTLATPAFIPLQPTPQNVLGGGTVESGPFLFDLRLFADTSFNQEPVASSLYSDMNGVGAFMYWCYQGDEPIGPIETYWGTLPQLSQLIQETYASIQPGGCGGRTGGILLPGGFFLSGESKVGDRVQVALKVRAGDEEFGAVISFALAQGPNGFEPINISVMPLQEQNGG